MPRLCRLGLTAIGPRAGKRSYIVSSRHGDQTVGGMPHDLALDHGDMRKQKQILGAQEINQIAQGLTPKGGGVDGVDDFDVSGRLQANLWSRRFRTFACRCHSQLSYSTVRAVCSLSLRWALSFPRTRELTGPALRASA